MTRGGCSNFLPSPASPGSPRALSASFPMPRPSIKHTGGQSPSRCGGQGRRAGGEGAGSVSCSGAEVGVGTGRKASSEGSVVRGRRRTQPGRAGFCSPAPRRRARGRAEDSRDPLRCRGPLNVVWSCRKTARPGTTFPARPHWVPAPRCHSKKGRCVLTPRPPRPALGGGVAFSRRFFKVWAAGFSLLARAAGESRRTSHMLVAKLSHCCQGPAPSSLPTPLCPGQAWAPPLLAPRAPALRRGLAGPGRGPPGLCGSASPRARLGAEASAAR